MKRTATIAELLVALLVTLLVATCCDAQQPSNVKASQGVREQLTPAQKATVELGRALYFDPRVGTDYEAHFRRTGSTFLLDTAGQPVVDKRTGKPLVAGTSCASCHDPALGFGDARPIALGRVGSERTPAGRLGNFRSPTTLNVQLVEFTENDRQFWDKRASGGLEQAVGPVANPDEMGQQSVQQMCDRLNLIAGYQELTRAAFGDPTLTPDRYAAACVLFQKTELVAIDTPLTRYLEGDAAAIPDEPGLRGAALFQANCLVCHAKPIYTTGRTADTGIEVAYGGEDDIGLQQTTGRQTDRFRFAIPGLVAIDMRKAFLTHESTFHNRDPKDPSYDPDEALKLLLAHYGQGGRFRDPASGQLRRDTNIDPRVARINLSAQDQADLLVTLTRDLTPADYPHDVAPKQMPQ